LELKEESEEQDGRAVLSSEEKNPGFLQAQSYRTDSALKASFQQVFSHICET
jgi:hypothetical protein